MEKPLSGSEFHGYRTVEGFNSSYVQTSLGGVANSNAQRRDSVIEDFYDSLNILGNDGFRAQDSFARWRNQTMIDSPGSVDDLVLESSFLVGQSAPLNSLAREHTQCSVPEQIFIITLVCPSWGFSNETTEILVAGYFREEYMDRANNNLLFLCGNVRIHAEFFQAGAYRCFVPPHEPGLVDLFISLDGYKPISQVQKFEYRSPFMSNVSIAPSEEDVREEAEFEKRLADKLFSSFESLSITSSKVSPYTLKEANNFSHRNTPSALAKDSSFELILKNRLKDWLLERVLDRSKAEEYDSRGQGVIHLCATLGYTWAIRFFSLSGLSLDFRDRRGWTALHWAAYYGREETVAALLSAGANPNLVTDPTSVNPGGHTVADIASMNGYDRLAAYISEKALVEQYKDMSVTGNFSGA